ncbi:MAG TPA: hypothetical protein VG520_04375 [Candidatus Dormibacteraeota bacterium]|nr:hypothetical protein [Candidatus Dormibacteraeota bacterium]
MPAPRDRKRSGEHKPARVAKKGPGRPVRAAAHGFPAVTDADFTLESPRAFRVPAEYRPESTAGLRRELIDLRAEVHRLAAEIDKLWARERGRAATPGRTARSIAGKPVRTGTRASRPAGGSAPAGAGRAGPKGGGAAGRTAAGRGTGGPKRSPGAKRGPGWAKPKSRPRRSGTTPRRKGR